MKKSLKSYVVIWAIGLAIFNLCSFLVPSETKFTANFWSGYGYITLAFILHLGTTFFAFKKENKEKVFLKIPVFAISFITLIITVVVGAFTMAVPSVPEWLGSILCFTCFGINVIASLFAKTAGDVVLKVDEKIKTQTFFIKVLTVDANTLVAQAKTPEIKAEATRVYEAIRYADPMSNENLAEIETKIQNQFNAFSVAVIDNDIELATELSKELLNLLEERNNKCKLLK